MAAGALVSVGTKLPRLAGLFKNVLRPAAGFVARNPIRTMAGVGATRGFMDQGISGIPGGAIQGGLMGVGLGGPLKAGLPGSVTRQLAGWGVAPGLAKNLTAIAPAAGLAGATYALSGQGGGNQVAGGLQGGAGNVIGAGVQNLQNEGNLIPMSALPPGYTPDANNMVRGPQGNWWYQYNPGGVAMGNRLGRQLDAQTDASNINTLGNALYGQTERVARAEFERQAAATQLASNIQQARQMALNSQEAGLRMGIDTNQNMAQAMSNRGNFRYF